MGRLQRRVMIHITTLLSDTISICISRRKESETYTTVSYMNSETLIKNEYPIMKSSTIDMSYYASCLTLYSAIFTPLSLRAS